MELKLKKIRFIHSCRLPKILHSTPDQLNTATHNIKTTYVTVPLSERKCFHHSFSEAKGISPHKTGKNKQNDTVEYNFSKIITRHPRLGFRST